jgi:ParB-like chromosome segregation protein Spo0J
MAKSGIQNLAKARSDLLHLDPTDIRVLDDWNSRDFEDPENIAHVAGLIESIRDVGVLEAVTVYWKDGGAILENGESRLRAVMALREQGVEIKTIPALASSRHASDADRVAAQMVRNSGKPFTVLEQARVFTQLSGFGWPDKDIAARCGLTVERVRQIMSLASVPQATQDLIKAGKISATVVQRIANKADTPEAVDAAVKAAVSAATKDGSAKAGPRHVAPASKPTPKAKVDFRELLSRLIDNLEDTENHGSLLAAIHPPLLAEIKEAL